MKYSIFCDDCHKPLVKQHIKDQHTAIMAGEPEFEDPERIAAVILAYTYGCKCGD